MLFIIDSNWNLSCSAQLRSEYMCHFCIWAYRFSTDNFLKTDYTRKAHERAKNSSLIRVLNLQLKYIEIVFFDKFSNSGEHHLHRKTPITIVFACFVTILPVV